MNDLERRFARILAEYPDTLAERRAFQGILRDVFPAEQQLVSALMAAYEMRIHEELSRGGISDPFFPRRFAKRLTNGSGLQPDLADRAVRLWVTGFPPGGLTARPKQKDPSPPLGRSASVSGLEEPTPVRSAPLPPQPASYYIPCGVGKQDHGFVVTGITDTPFCSHPQASIYAVVFSYLQRSLDARPGEHVREIQARTRLTMDYARVYRLQMVLLLLIKNNCCTGDVLEIAFEGDPAEADAAMENINYYARLFSTLADMPYRDMSLSIRVSGCARVSLAPRTGCISVSDCADRDSARRVMWHGRRIKYDIDEHNQDALLVLLREAFGYKSFLDGQREALFQMLRADDRHSVCIMPTGAGKSLVFYLLAMLQSCPTFVICPTDLLIRDQLRNLREQHGIDDAVHLLPNVDYRGFAPANKLIYLTPYTFLHHQLILRLIELNYTQSMGHVVMDEVHCISNWSHDFRPEYLMLSFNLRQFVDKTGYRCFTATADYTVVRDIQRQLDIRAEDVICPVPLSCRTPHFEFVACSSEQELFSATAAKVAGLLEAGKHDGTRALVFTKTAGASMVLQEELQAKHAAYVDVYCPDDPRSYTHFAEGDCSVLIADSDLGVGVNLPNVTHTVHVGLPISKGHFVQELGRAGRGDDRASTTVMFVARDSYPASARAFLHRGTRIEDLMELCASGALHRDARDALFRSIGGIEPQESFYQGTLHVYHALRSFTEGGEVSFRTSQTEQIDGQADRFMRYLYVLYRVGALFGWYIIHLDNASGTMTFFIDPKGTEPRPRSAQDVRHITATYLHAMGTDPSTIAAVKSARSVEETIHHYVEWHYHQFLYHHREQLLEMQDFLEAYRGRDDETILEALSAYFSLSLLEVQRNAATAVGLTIKDITLTFSQGASANMVDSLTKLNEDSYSAKLDYFLFGHHLFGLAHTDMSRFQRIVDSLSEIEFSELLEHVGVIYEACDERDRLLVLNALCRRTDLKRVIDAVYSRINYDLVFCAVLALCANKRMGA